MNSSRNEAFRHETNLRQLELVVTRKLDGLLHGEYQTAFYGPGSERGDSRAYQPGDDARRIDWSVTARMNELFVRDTLADRELESWLVVDTSASLDFGTVRWEKRELALTMAAAFGLLGARSGNRTGAVVFDGSGSQVIPPRAGRNAMLQLLRRIDQRPPAPNAVASLAEALRTTRSSARRRGRVVVISDLIDAGNWAGELRNLAVKHEVIVVQVCDPRDWELPAAGLLTLVDPESGRRVEVQTNNPKLRAKFRAAAEQRRAEINTAVRTSGARHLTVSTDRDWMLDLVRFAKHARQAG